MCVIKLRFRIAVQNKDFYRNCLYFYDFIPNDLSPIFDTDLA